MIPAVELLNDQSLGRDMFGAKRLSANRAKIPMSGTQKSTAIIADVEDSSGMRLFRTGTGVYFICYEIIGRRLHCAAIDFTFVPKRRRSYRNIQQLGRNYSYLTLICCNSSGAVGSP